MLGASPSLRRVATNSGLVLLDEASDRLWAYNDTAREIWDRLREGAPAETVAAEIADRYGIDLEIALPDVVRIVGEWGANGLAGDRGDTVSAAPARPPVDWTGGPRPEWALSLTCTIRDKVIAFDVEPSAAARFVQIFYRHLATPGAHAAIRVELRDAEDGMTALVVDGIERLRTGDGGELIGALNQAVLELVNPGVDWLAMIHGGAIARNARGIALPAACGSGKTTLVAHLLPRGYDYLADDLIALAAPDGRIVPLPLPLSVKEGSWDLLAGAYPEIVQAPRYETARGQSRQLVPPANAWDRDPVPLRAFVFPKYVAGAPTTFTRITPLEALQRLLGDRMWLGYPLKQRHVEAFIAWLEDKPAYDLVHGDAADAARRIEEIA